MESGIRDGRYFRNAESKKHTVGDLLNRFITQWLPKYPQREAKQTALLNWWRERSGHLLLVDLTPAVIAEGRDHLRSEITVRGQIRSPSTVNRYLSALGKALTVAVKEWGWLETSPVSKVTKPPEARGRERFLSGAEKDRLLHECRQSRNANLLPMVALALITGMRFGELAELHWRDIDLGQRTITLVLTKNGDRRIIPLTADAEEILKACPSFGNGQDELIFQSRRNSQIRRRVSIRGAFEAAVRRSGIKDFRFHDLRHSAASHMAMSGATQGELMAILGHKSPAMTRRYAHYSQSHLLKVLERTEMAYGIKKFCCNDKEIQDV